MSVVDEQPCISVITLLRGEKEFIPLIKANFQEFNYPKDKLDLIIIDDGKESLLEEFLDDDRYLYLYLNESEIKEFIEKINFPNDKDDILKNYQTRVKRLPNGFKRDYGVGMSSNEYFFHMDYDTSYHKDSITRKLKFLKKNRIDCVYNSNILCHDFHSKDYTKLYKSESPYRLYESTLFHNKEYWSNGGFKWSDITNEGRFFSDNHGPQRRMDNYYDSVKLLNIRNVQDYRPIALDLDKSEFTYELKKDTINNIQIQLNPVRDGVEELFTDIDTIQVLGIQSEFIESLDEDSRYSCYNLEGKIKQTKIAKEIKKINNEFNVLLFGSKQPAWSIFEEIKFDSIILETQKNMEQMHSIIQQCKKYKYIYLNGIYINEELLKK
jgi:hypothetical protein